MIKINNYFNFPGNTEEAFRFYQSVFGGEFSSLVRFKDMPMEGFSLPKGDEDKIMHISLPIGKDDALMASDALESLGQKVIPGNNTYIFIHPDSKEEADLLFNALAQDGEVEMPMADQPWGDYYGSFRDKFGILWMISFAYPKPE